LRTIIWHKFVWERQTLKNLSRSYKRSIKWVRLHLAKAQVVYRSVVPQPIIAAADATFFKRQLGIIVFRVPKLKRNIYWKEISYEAISCYSDARTYLEQQGFKFKAIVLDGRPGVRAVFNDIPVQMCQFHQKQIINRYLTTRPKLQASIELRSIVQSLCQLKENEFTNRLNNWYEKWTIFLKEKTFNPETRKWFYTHRRIRSAYRSLNKNLPYIFTYQKYPKLDIPNTTNSLDGSFTHLKGLVRVHRGITQRLKRKIIDEILAK